MAAVVFADVAEGFFQWAVLGDVVAHVDEDESFDVGGLGHACGGDGAGLSIVKASLFQYGVVVAAHAEHHIGVACEVDHGIARFRIAGEDDRFAGRGIDAVGERVEVWLDVYAGRRGDFPLVGGSDGAGSDVSGVDDWWSAGQRAASVHVDVLADWKVDAGIPIVGKDAFFLIEDSVRQAFGGRRPVNAERVFLTDRLVPSAKQETGVIDVVVEVVVGEEDVVDLSGEESYFDEFVRGCGAAVEHEFVAIDVEDESGSEARRCRMRAASAEDVEGCVVVCAHI